MAARRVLAVHLDQFLIGGQVGAIPDGRDRLTAGGVDQGQFSIDHVVRRGRVWDRQAEQLGGNGKIGHVPQGRVLQRSADQGLVLGRAGCQHGAGQRFEIDDEVVGLQVAQHFIEEQVIDMIDRVGGDEHRALHVPAALVDLVELTELARYRRSDHETVLGQ